MKCENDLCGLCIDDGFCAFSRTKKYGCHQREKAKGRAALTEWAEKQIKAELLGLKADILDCLKEIEKYDVHHPDWAQDEEKWMVSYLSEYFCLVLMLEQAKGEC